MKKRTTVFILILSLMLSLFPAGVFASEQEISLEAGFGDGCYGDNCTIKAGESKVVQFYVGEDNGDDVECDTKISATGEDFAVYDDEGKTTSEVKLTAFENGRMKISPSRNINERTEFYIRYIGDRYEFSAGNSFRVKVTVPQAKTIKDYTVTNLALKADKSGIQITFDNLKKADGYKIYRSTQKSLGYKVIANVSENEFYDCASLTKGTRYYYKVRGYMKLGDETIYSKYSDVVSAKSKVTAKKATTKSVTAMHLDSHDKSLLEEAYIFGVSNDIEFKYGATSQTGVLNNLQYAFLIGDYELGFAYSSRSKAEAACDMISDLLSEKEYDSIYTDIFCAYNNAVLQFETTYEHGVYCIYMSVQNASLSDETIFSNQKKAVEKIKEIAAQMHEEGKITSGMTQKEIAEVYYDYVSSADTKYFSDDMTILSRGLCMQQDTPYSFLFTGYASCLGHTATYNQLLHYEGIEAYGATNWFGNVSGQNGHIISYIICDGTEYFTDTTNQIDLTDQAGIEKYLIFRGGSLQRVRDVANN